MRDAVARHYPAIMWCNSGRNRFDYVCGGANPKYPLAGFGFLQRHAQ
jgi:hypothetical protein